MFKLLYDKRPLRSIRPPSSTRLYKSKPLLMDALVFHSCLRPRELRKKLFFSRTRRFLRQIKSVRKMKGYLLVSLVSLVALAVANEKYTGKYDDVNVDKILQNNRVLTNYIRCLMDEGPCTAEGRELRKTLPDALSNGCDKCNDKQKVMAEKVINHLKTKRSRDWDRLVAKYDPHGEYKKRYEKS